MHSVYNLMAQVYIESAVQGDCFTWVPAGFLRSFESDATKSLIGNANIIHEDILGLTTLHTLNVTRNHQL